jgi:hypothetical protein
MLNENWYRDVQGHDGDASDDLGALDNRQASLTESNKITTTSSSTMSSTSISENTVETTTSSSIMSSTSISVNTAESTTDVVQSTNSPEGSVSTQPSSSKHDGVSGGAVAGAAVGCLVVGILVGFLAAFLLFKRRMKGSPATKLKRQSSEFTTLASKTEIYSNDRQIDISQFLLDGSSDEDIASELHSLSDLIYQHVENHYHLRPVRIDSYTLAQKFAQIGLTKASGWGPDAIAALCIDIKSRHAGLRHVISQILFQNIDINIPGPLSLLPPSISAFLQTRPVINSSYRKSPGMEKTICEIVTVLYYSCPKLTVFSILYCNITMAQALGFTSPSEPRRKNTSVSL